MKSLCDKISLNGCTGKVDEVWAVDITPATLEKNGFKHGIGHIYYHEYEEEIYPVKFFIEYNALNWCLLVGSQSEQKKFIGNAVEVNMARQLCETLARCV